MAPGGPEGALASRQEEAYRLQPLLEVDRLQTSFFTKTGVVQAVNDVSFTIEPGSALGLVGESGSGKTALVQSIMRIVDRPGRIVGGRILFQGEDLLAKNEAEMRQIRGKEMAMIFQDPRSSLNPVLRVGELISEAIRWHADSRGGANPVREILRKFTPATTAREQHESWQGALELMRLVNIPTPQQRAYEFPHQFSGGMAQRVAIAIALAGQPKLLIADEPTTALDVTVEAQILDLLSDIKRRFGMALLYISHDLSVVAEICDHTAVMYAGQIVELGPTEALATHPRHPYTQQLMACAPRIEDDMIWLPTIPGSVPDLIDPPQEACLFAPRCPLATELCRQQAPPTKVGVGGHWVRCHFAE